MATLTGKHNNLNVLLSIVYSDAGIDLSKPVIGMCSGGMSSSSLVLGAYLCGCPHAALYHVRHLIFSFISRFTSVSILIHIVDTVDSFSTEHSKLLLWTPQ